MRIVYVNCESRHDLFYYRHLVGNVCDASATCQQCRVKSPIFCWQGKCADTVTWALYYENTQKYKEKITNKLLKDLFINIVMSMTCISNIYLSNIPIEVFDITSQGNMHQFRDMSARRVATRQYDMSFGPFSWHVSCRHFQLSILVCLGDCHYLVVLYFPASDCQSHPMYR